MARVLDQSSRHFHKNKTSQLCYFPRLAALGRPPAAKKGRANSNGRRAACEVKLATRVGTTSAQQGEIISLRGCLLAARVGMLLHNGYAILNAKRREQGLQYLRRTHPLKGKRSFREDQFPSKAINARRSRCEYFRAW